jgi:hypothetical protein
MDLLVLFSHAAVIPVAPVRGFQKPGMAKGKEKEAGLKSKVGLWRMSGAKVWEADVEGKVLGMAWSRDGRYTPDSPDDRSGSVHFDSQTVRLANDASAVG